MPKDPLFFPIIEFFIFPAIQHEDIDMDEGNDANSDICGGMHQCILTKGLKPSDDARRLAALRASFALV